MTETSFGALVNTPPRRRPVVMSLKNHFSIFSDEAQVGLKCMWARGCFSSHT